MSTPPRVVVLVISWNRPELTLRCVQSLSKLAYPRYELVIIENGGSRAAAWLRHQLPAVHVVASPTNLGFAGGSNLGLLHARRRGADYVLLLNNDTVVPPDALCSLLELAQAHPEVGFLSPTIRYLAAPHRIWFRGSRFRPDLLLFEHLGKDGEPQHEEPSSALPELIFTDYACGCAILARSSALARVGGFDPRYFLLYEDADLGARARKLGIASAVATRVEIQHQVAASFGGAETPSHSYYGLRNALLYAELHLPRLDYLRLVEHSARLALAPLSLPAGVARLPGLAALVRRQRLRASAATEPWARARLLGLRDYALRRFGAGPHLSAAAPLHPRP